MLEEELEVRGMTKKALAAMIGRPPQFVNELMKGKRPLSVDTALRLQAALGIDAQLWLNMETRYRLQEQRLTVPSALAMVSERRARYEASRNTD